LHIRLHVCNPNDQNNFASLLLNICTFNQGPVKKILCHSPLNFWGRKKKQPKNMFVILTYSSQSYL
jgi:hypothetical protein